MELLSPAEPSSLVVLVALLGGCHASSQFVHSSVSLPYSRPSVSVVVDGGRLNIFGTFGYVLGCTKTGEGAIVDPGGCPEMLMTLAGQHGITINKILLTHEHLDHISAASILKRLNNATILMHTAGFGMYRAYGVPVPFASSGLWEHPILLRMVGVLGRVLLQTDYAQPPYNVQFVTDGDHLTVGAIRLRVVHLPGHSQGSVAFVSDHLGLVFAGDVAMGGVVGRTDLPGCSGASMAQSLRLLQGELARAPEGAVLFTGHAPPTTAAAELAWNPSLRSQWRFWRSHFYWNSVPALLVIGLLAYICKSWCSRHHVRAKQI